MFVHRNHHKNFKPTYLNAPAVLLSLFRLCTLRRRIKKTIFNLYSCVWLPFESQKSDHRCVKLAWVMSNLSFLMSHSFNKETKPHQFPRNIVQMALIMFKDQSSAPTLGYKRLHQVLLPWSHDISLNSNQPRACLFFFYIARNDPDIHRSFTYELQFNDKGISTNEKWVMLR